MKILTVYALRAEAVALDTVASPHQFIEIYTGIGKTQAAASLAFALRSFSPDAVLNVGTAGTSRHHIGDILVARHFVDRDLQKLPLDCVSKTIDVTDITFGERLPSVVQGQETFDPMSVSTGDSFVMSADEDLGCDAVDMESFALAWVCKQERVPFLSVKYITDILGQNSVQAWADKLGNARRDLQAYFHRYL